LVDTGRCWVELSAPYDTSKSGSMAFRSDAAALAHASARTKTRAVQVL